MIARLSWAIALLGIALAYTDVALLEEQISELVAEPKLASVRSRHSSLYKAAQNAALAAKVEYGVASFDCGVGVSNSTPVSVHALRPGDISVVAAMGDSLTAANGAGASSLPDVLQEYRGLAFSIGGDGDLAEMTTIPNILRTFNPAVSGASSGVGPVYVTEKSQLNVAVPGAKIWDLPGQADELIKRIKEDDSINITEDWKLVTLFIGSNDLCQMCQGAEENGPKNDPFAAPTTKLPWWRRLPTRPSRVPWWRRSRGSTQLPWWKRTRASHRPWWKRTSPPPTTTSTTTAPPPPTPKPPRIQPLEEALRKLHDGLPRTLVSVVNAPHVEQLAETHDQSFLCKLMHRLECPCLTTEGYNLDGFKSIVHQLQRQIAKATESPALRDRDDFTVELQPLLEGAEIPKNGSEVDLSFFAPDCFHWSQLGHSYVAAGLWNNMMHAKAAKSHAAHFELGKPEVLNCPDPACPFIRTDANSADCAKFLPTEAPPNPSSAAPEAPTTEAEPATSAAPEAPTTAAPPLPPLPTSTTAPPPPPPTSTTTDIPPPTTTTAAGNSSLNGSSVDEGPLLPIFLEPEQGDDVASLLPAVVLMAAANRPITEGGPSLFAITILAGVGLVALSALLISGIVYKGYKGKGPYRPLNGDADGETEAPEGFSASRVRRSICGTRPEEEPLLHKVY